MATGHTTYSTVHADSAKSLIHRLEGKPIEIPRALLQSLDIVLIQTNTQHEDRNVRRCKQIIEIIDIDSLTDEILTNEVFHWDPVEDEYIFSGKSYVLERLRTQLGMSTEEMTGEISRRVEILKWMHKNKIRVFNDVAKIVSSYVETPDELIAEIRKNPIKIKEKDNGTSYIQKSKETGKLDVDVDNVATEKKKITFSSLLFNKRGKKDKVAEKSKEKKGRGIGASETPIQNKKNMKLEDENDSNKATKI